MGTRSSLLTGRESRSRPIATERIAFTGRDAAQQLHIFIVSAEGGEQRQVTHLTAAQGRAQMPAWSADGRQLAVQVNEGNQASATSHLWTVEVATGAAHKLAAHTTAYLDEIRPGFPMETGSPFRAIVQGGWKCG